MGLEVGKPFEKIAGFSVTDACVKPEDILGELHDLDKTPLEGSRDVFMHEKSTSLGCNNDLPNPLDHFHVSPICSLPSTSPESYINTPIENPMIFLW